MRPVHKGLNWRIVFGVCSLIYMIVMVYLSGSNFGMVHREYRQAVRQLQPFEVEKTARLELADECRKKEKKGGHSLQTDERKTAKAGVPCLSPPAVDLEKRQKIVRDWLEKKKSGIIQKMVLFYITFAIFFLVLPPVIIYLVLSVFIWIFKSIE